VRLCRFADRRLGLVEGSGLKDVTEALDALPSCRYPFPPGDLFITHLDRVLERVKALGANAPTLPLAERLVLTSPDGILATFAVAEAERAFGLPVAVLKGGTAAWRAEDRPLASGIEDAFLPIDDVYKRPYEGTDNATEAMEAYIAWELGLVAQLERDGTCNFKLL